MLFEIMWNRSLLDSWWNMAKHIFSHVYVHIVLYIYVYRIPRYTGEEKSYARMVTDENFQNKWNFISQNKNWFWVNSCSFFLMFKKNIIHMEMFKKIWTISKRIITNIKEPKRLALVLVLHRTENNRFFSKRIAYSSKEYIAVVNN